ncbi:MAG: hypothetical protein KDA32_01930 [Phycisphaerales bacterium]|nr:hypothetical protein [Phycisphaerales bacterium]
MSPIWYPFIYQYGVGSAVFVIGLILILRSGACDLSNRRDRFWFGVLIGGFCCYFGMHLLWYLAALYIYPDSATPLHG